MKKLSYICPACDKEQDAVMFWNTASVGTRFDGETWEQMRSVDGDFESWNCPDCDNELDGNLEAIIRTDGTERIVKIKNLSSL